MLSFGFSVSLALELNMLNSADRIILHRSKSYEHNVDLLINL